MATMCGGPVGSAYLTTYTSNIFIYMVAPYKINVRRIRNLRTKGDFRNVRRRRIIQTKGDFENVRRRIN